MPRKAKKSSVLDELDTRPLTDSEVMAMGYEPDPELGWKPFRRDLLPEPENTPEQVELLENHKVAPKASTSAKRKVRAARKGRPARK